MDSSNLKEKAQNQACAAALGAAFGAVTKQTFTPPRPMKGGLAAQVASASAAAAVGGAGLSGSAAAGAAVVTAKVAAVATAATVAAPFVAAAAVVGGVGYGLYRLFKS